MYLCINYDYDCLLAHVLANPSAMRVLLFANIHCNLLLTTLTEQLSSFS